MEKEELHILDGARNCDAWRDRGIAVDCLRRAVETGWEGSKEAIIGGDAIQPGETGDQASNGSSEGIKWAERTKLPEDG